MRLIMRLAALLLALPGTALACGQETDCETSSGTYRIVLPEGPGPHGAMLWLHGWGGSAAGVMKNRALISQVTARGMAVVAADGRVTSPVRPNKNWAVRDGRSYERDDIAFLTEILADAETRHGIDRSAVLLSGFSRGGSMVWDVACHAPELARAYAPVAGAFWEPLPKACAAPVDLFHVHGWTDRTVPLEGRSLRGGTMIQGDVFQSLFILRATNGCSNRQPELGSTTTPFWQRVWSDCRAGRIDFLLHAGGHSLPKGWLARALDWFEDRRAEDAPG